MTITLIDSPVANVANIARALRHVGAELCLTADPEVLARATKIVLPGVGSFAAAIAWLARAGLDVALRRAVVERGATLLGICVGHQLLFDRSSEMGETAGLGLVRGDVVRLESALPVPQIGWNRVFRADGGQETNHLFEAVEDGTPFYFVHSFAVRQSDAASTVASYGGPFVASIDAPAGRGRVLGVQFHPEKSSAAGLRVLRNFTEGLA